MMGAVSEAEINAQLIAAYGATVEQFADPRWRIDHLYTKSSTTRA
jgi:hypothetical protein